MNMFYDFTFNGKNSLDMGLAIKTEPIYHVSQRNRKFEEVAGRSGAIINDQGTYKNVKVKYKVYTIPTRIEHQTDQRTVYDFIDWLNTDDYAELRDCYNEGYFTKAVCSNLGDIETHFRGFNDGTIEFNREPFWYSDLGQKEISATTNISINNPERYISKPDIIIYGSGVCTLTVNGIEYSFTAVSDYLHIDGETGNCDKDGVLVNTKANFSYPPTLNSGVNTISKNVNITRIVIKPNWRRL